MRRKLLMNLDMSLMRNILTAICSEEKRKMTTITLQWGRDGHVSRRTEANCFTNALQRSSETSSTPYVNLAQYYMKRNRLDDAEHMFREAVR